MTTYETLLSKTEMEALRRFAECCEDSDSGGHDVPKMMMKRLASAGAVVCTSTRWGIYETTKFGNLLLDMHRDVIAPVADESDAVDVAIALEQRRALEIVAAVRAQGFAKSDTLIPTQAESVYDLACEEIETRLRGEQWSLAGISAPLPATPETIPVPAGDATAINGVSATLCHDEGAIAQCFYCKRYSLDCKTLSERPPMCDCGEKHGWSGSFLKPGPGALWSGTAPKGESS